MALIHNSLDSVLRKRVIVPFNVTMAYLNGYLTIGGESYVVMGINENNCGTNCITLDKEFAGDAVNAGNPGIKIYLGDATTSTYEFIIEKKIRLAKYNHGRTCI